MELSCGTYEQSAWHYPIECTRAREAFFLGFAEKVVPYVRMTKTLVIDGARSVGAMVDILEAGWSASAVASSAFLTNRILVSETCCQEHRCDGWAAMRSPFSHSDKKSVSLFKDVVARTAQVTESKGRL
ncbi:hypothetical protein CDEST_01431 [Colletotrichum destructivum]|uniref:Uncharacterized protein n=1 Tax=Colletotrichum destructivum TaxID=34406 RepID=A0AAX4HZA5_9PEZI|nr:hypothetical protein CDEST_01431 [Colletotrichum destructivum]